MSIMRMPQYVASAPPSMEFARDGGGCAALGCGIPLVLTAAGALAYGFPDTSLLGSRLIATAAVVAAVLIAATRSRIVLDPVAGAAVDTLRIGVTVRRRVRPFTEFAHVSLRYTVQGRPAPIQEASSGAPCAFWITLEGRGEALALAMGADYARARDLAERVARLTGLPLLALQSGTDALEVDDAPTVPPPLEPPAGARSQLRVEADAVVVDIPAPGWTRRARLLTFVGGLAPAFFLMLLLSPALVPAGERLAGPGPFLLTGLVAGPLFLASLWVGVRLPLSTATRAERVTAAPRGLRLQWTSRAGDGDTTVDVVDEILVKAASDDGRRMFVPPGLVLCVRHRDTALELGLGLQDAELRWLRDVLRWHGR